MMRMMRMMMMMIMEAVMGGLKEGDVEKAVVLPTKLCRVVRPGPFGSE